MYICLVCKNSYETIAHNGGCPICWDRGGTHKHIACKRCDTVTGDGFEGTKDGYSSLRCRRCRKSMDNPEYHCSTDEDDY